MHISADTYEKVDAAVAIVEPLLIPVDVSQDCQMSSCFFEHYSVES